MSVAMARAEGVNVLTVTFDPKSHWPPLCQILNGLCYNPVCCSVSQSMRSSQKNSQSLLGALHIMVGLLNIGMGVIFISSGDDFWWQWDVSPLWLGGLFVLFGISCILSEKYPSPCLVICNVILHLAGVAFAIAAIVLYSINIANIGFWWMCDRNDNYWDSYPYQTPKPTLSAAERRKQENCLEAKELLILLVRGINGVLIVLAALELCLVISSAVLGMKALKNRGKEKSKGSEDPEKYQPLLESVTA
ncbi:unnamed protein product [Lampetra planeri]